MAQINSLEDFKYWIKAELGFPVITIELCDEVHLQHAIDEAVAEFTRYNYNEGNYKDFLLLNLSAGVADYNLSGSGLSNVVDIIMSIGGSGNINTLFTPVNMIMSPMDFVRLGNFQIMDYHIAMLKLEEIKEYFTIQYNAKYNTGSQVLKLTPTPSENMRVMMEVYKKETAINLYNNQLVKHLALAKALIILGRILRKFTINLPGGGTINGTEMLSEGKELYAEAMIDIKGESEPPGFFIA